MSEINIQNLVADLDKTIHEYGYEKSILCTIWWSCVCLGLSTYIIKIINLLVNSKGMTVPILWGNHGNLNYEEAKHFYQKNGNLCSVNRLEIQTGHPPYYHPPLGWYHRITIVPS